MPERKNSVDSFEDFFGDVPKQKETTKLRTPSPVASEKGNVSISSAAIRNQSTTNRQKSPDERSISPFQSKSKAPGSERKRSAKNDRPASIQSKTYESDFDDDEAYEDVDEPVIERKQHSSEPQKKERVTSSRRRGSDSDVKTSYTLPPRRHQSNNDRTQRRDPMLPTIRTTASRRPPFPVVRRRKEFTDLDTKSEQEKRVQSAKNDKLRALESRIAELRRELEAQRIENSTLRTIQRREEKAIKRYEEKEYDIHRIVRDYNHEIEHVKRTLSAEREMKLRLEKQVEAREEKLRDQTKRLKQYEKIVQEKNLEERHELQEKIKEVDKKLQEYQEKLATQERYIENLEKNHRHEIKQELVKQRQLKRELETRVEKYNDLLMKYEEKNRQVETMHIYAQRTTKASPDSPKNLSKSRSLQSLNDTSPRTREKPIDSDRRRREKKDQSGDVQSRKTEKPKPKVKVEASPTRPINEEKPMNKSNGHLPPKSKPIVRRSSTPDSIQEEIKTDDLKSNKSPRIERDENYLTHAQIHKRSTASNLNSEKNAGGSSIFKLTEPASVPSNNRPKRDLDAKWSDMFGSSNADDPAKEDLLSKLVADEQKERKAAASMSNPRSSNITYEPSTRTTVKPASDPFDTLFGSSASRPTPATRANDLEDIFGSKPSAQTRSTSKNDPFESLFGDSKASNGDKLQRSKGVTNGTKSIPNRTIFDEVEELVI